MVTNVMDLTHLIVKTKIFSGTATSENDRNTKINEAVNNKVITDQEQAILQDHLNTLEAVCQANDKDMQSPAEMLELRNDLKAQQDKNNSSIKSTESDITTQVKQISTLEGSLQEKTKELADLKTHFASHEDKLKKIDSDISYSDERDAAIKPVQNEMAALQKEIAAANEKKQQLEQTQKKQMDDQANLKKSLDAVMAQCDVLNLNPSLTNTADNSAEMSFRPVAPREPVSWSQAVKKVNENLDKDKEIDPNKYQISSKKSGNFDVTLNGKALLNVKDDKITSTPEMRKLPIEERAKLMAAATVAQGHDKNTPLTVKCENKELKAAIVKELKSQGYEHVNDTKKVAPSATLQQDKTLEKDKEADLEVSPSPRPQ